jgi:hypothetical protein
MGRRSPIVYFSSVREDMVGKELSYSRKRFRGEEIKPVLENFENNSFYFQFWEAFEKKNKAVEMDGYDKDVNTEMSKRQKF